MKKLSYVISCLLLLVLYTSCTQENQQTISAKQASKYIGKNKTVCGKVVSANYAFRSKGKPTFLNLDKPYPGNIFTIVIWGSNRAKFQESPEIYYRNKTICVTGLIKEYRGKPQIEVSKPSQIIIKDLLEQRESLLEQISDAEQTIDYQKLFIYEFRVVLQKINQNIDLDRAYAFEKAKIDYKYLGDSISYFDPDSVMIRWEESWQDSLKDLQEWFEFHTILLGYFEEDLDSLDSALKKVWFDLYGIK